MNAKIDRVIANKSNNADQVSLLVKSAFGVNSTSANQSLNASWAFMRGTDDWISVAQQYTEYRFNWMRFDIYYTDPAANLPIYASTFHGDFSGVPPTAWTNLDGVIDGSDSTVVTSTSGKATLYWIASGAREKGYYSEVADQDFGGLRMFVPAGAGTLGSIARVIITAQCVFRGRE